MHCVMRVADAIGIQTVARLDRQAVRPTGKSPRQTFMKQTFDMNTVTSPLSITDPCPECHQSGFLTFGSKRHCLHCRTWLDEDQNPPVRFKGTEFEFIEFLRNHPLVTNLFVDDDLDFRGLQDHISRMGIIALPKILSVNGDLILTRTGITTFPHILSVSGSLDLSETRITDLPHILMVGGSLYLDWCAALNALPENISVGHGRYLTFQGCTRLKEARVPSGVKKVDLRGTQLRTLRIGDTDISI